MASSPGARHRLRQRLDFCHDAVSLSAHAIARYRETLYRFSGPNSKVGAMCRVLIYGSCVTRDIIRLHDGRFEPSHYIARQSLISGFTRPVPRVPTPNLKSSFMRRTLIGDFKSDAPEIIRQHLPSSDVLVIDFASDKRGVVPLREGGFVSFTQELSQSKLLAEYPHGARIKFGTDHHFALWQAAARDLKDLLSTMSSFHRTVIIAAPFTDHAADGQPVQPFHGIPATELNQMYERYYNYVENLGFHVVRLPEILAIGNPDHLWGLAHDHYIDDAYTWMADEISSFTKLVFSGDVN